MRTLPILARLFIGTLIATTALAEDDPKIKATLFSEHASLAPNSTTTLAVKIDIPDKWHIYHPIVLDTGLPTELSLTLPPGVTAGPVRYPSPVFAATETGSASQDEQATEPKKTVIDLKGKASIEFKASDDSIAISSGSKMSPSSPTGGAEPAVQSRAQTIDYLGYEGEAVLLVELTADSSLTPGSKANIGAFITALICEHNGKCIPVDTSATFELPITSALGAAQHANLFKNARRALPATLSEAPYLKGSTLTTKHSQLPIGAESELILTLNIGKGYHVQHHDPGVEGLIPTRVWIEAPDGITFDTDKQVWPKPKTEEIEYIGNVRQQSGKTVIRTPFKVTDPLFTPGDVKLHVLVEYQTCSDTGQCFPPTQAIGAVNFEVVAADTQAQPWQKPEQVTKPGWAAMVTTDESDPADPQVAQAESDDADETVTAASDTPSSGSMGLLALLLTFGGAFLGGIILNIMPCVLPVVSLKIFGFVNQAGEDHGRVFKMGLVYALGVLVSFFPLAIAIALFNQAWGAVIFQSPVAIALLSGFMLTFGLSMIGLYEIQLPGSAASAAGGAVQREGYAGAFTSGLLTTALATPCTGPFLGPALGVLATQTATVAFTGVMLVGAGLAFPYVLLSAVPGWLKYLPKPGNWMVTFKQVTGLVILGVPLWLLMTIRDYDDPQLLYGIVVFLFGVGVASFVLSKIDINASFAKTTKVFSLATAIAVAGWFIGPVYFGRIFAEPVTESQAPVQIATSEQATIDVAALYNGSEGPELTWQKWQPELPEQLAEAGYTVYVDFTATWCLTCQTNKATVLHTNEIYSLFKEMNVVPLKADFTRRNPEIQAELRRFERNGVPLNLIYPANNPEAVITMPELLTQAIVSDRLKQAGPTTAIGASTEAVASR